MAYPRLKEQHNVALVPHSYYHKYFESNFYMKQHSHPYVEIMYCREGEIVIEIFNKAKNGTLKSEQIILKEKQFILLDAGVLHGVLCGKNKNAFVSNIEWKPTPLQEQSEINKLVMINTDAFFESFEGLKKFINCPNRYMVALDGENVEHCLVTYINLAIEKNKTAWDKCNLQARFIQLLTELDKCLCTPTVSTGINYIRRAQLFIKNNFNRQISVDDIAEHTGITKGYLQRLFKSHTEMSVLQYLNNFRITKCKRILIETNLSIDDICSHVGFNNRQQLIYEFKAQMGITPTAYRQAQAKKYFEYNPAKGEYISSDRDGNPIF